MQFAVSVLVVAAALALGCASVVHASSVKTRVLAAAQGSDLGAFEKVLVDEGCPEKILPLIAEPLGRKTDERLVKAMLLVVRNRCTVTRQELIDAGALPDYKHYCGFLDKWVHYEALSSVLYTTGALPEDWKREYCRIGLGKEFSGLFFVAAAVNNYPQAAKRIASYCKEEMGSEPIVHAAIASILWSDDRMLEAVLDNGGCEAAKDSLLQPHTLAAIDAADSPSKLIGVIQEHCVYGFFDILDALRHRFAHSRTRDALLDLARDLRPRGFRKSIDSSTRRDRKSLPAPLTRASYEPLLFKDVEEEPESSRSSDAGELSDSEGSDDARKTSPYIRTSGTIYITKKSRT